MKNTLKYGILILLLCRISHAFGNETRYHITNITNRDGLSNSSINVITQDDDGVLWFGTWDGLNSYNGKKITIYKAEPNEPFSITNNIIWHLEVDGNFIWVATDKSIEKLDRKTGNFEHFLVDYTQVPTIEHSFELHRSTKNEIVAYIRNRGFFVYDSASNRFNFATNVELKEKQSCNLPENIPFSDDAKILCCYHGSQNIFWLGTDMQGVYMFVPAKYKFHSFTNKNFPNLSSNAVRSFAINGDKLFLATKGNGIIVLNNNDPENPKFLNNFTTKNGLINNSVFSLAKGFNNEIWIGHDGKGLNYYDLQKDLVYKLQGFQDSLPSLVYAIYVEDRNTLWVGTNGQGLYKIVFDNKSNPYSVKQISNFRFSNNSIFSIIKDDDNHIWIGSRGGGLIKFNTKNNSYLTYRLSQFSDNYSNDDILCLHKDGNKLWAGTSLGLQQLIFSDDSIVKSKLFTSKDGLPSNTVRGILADKNNDLWLSTTMGLAKFVNSDENVNIINYKEKDGLQNDEFSDGAYYKNGDFLYFGGINGYSSFLPSEIEEDRFIAPIILEEFYSNNSSANIADHLVGNKLQLKYGHNSVFFRFNSIDYISGDKYEYSYIVVGLNDDWINIGNSSTVVLSNLPSGDYVLKVKNISAEKKLNDKIFEIPIRVNKPWWLSWWAILAYCGILVAIVLLTRAFFKYRLKILNDIRNKDIEKQKAEDIHQAKLQFFTGIAHEFSNSLTLIYAPNEQLSSMFNDDEDVLKYTDSIRINAERMQSLIKQLVDFRKVDSDSVNIVIQKINISELVHFVLEHFMETINKKNITIKISEPDEASFLNSDLDGLKTIMFNLLSNAVRYTSSGYEIIVKIEKTDNKLVFTVTNTGTGIPDADKDVIFDRFKVLDRIEKKFSQDMKIRSGIGLALCSTWVEKLDGNIVLQSDGISYTSFVVSLPDKKESLVNLQNSNSDILVPYEYFEEKEENQETTAKISDNTEMSALPIVLVIDDDDGIRTLLIDILKHKYKVLSACNGKEGLDVINEQQPDIILCDLMMPVMDGIMFLNAIKTSASNKHIPVVILSSKASIESKLMGLDTGADAYLEKPFHPKYLLALLERILQNKKNILDYSSSHYAGLEKFRGKEIGKEDKIFILGVNKIILDNISREELSPDFISDKLNISKITFYRKMKDLFSQTPVDYIRSIRLEQAKKLLLTTDMPVKEIMFDCGFNNKAYFYREFTKHYGSAPKQYRDKG